MSKTEKRQEILDACIAVFVNNGLTDTGMRDLASGTLINVSSFYKYFESKEEIVEECVKKCIENIEDNIKSEYNNLTPDFKSEIRKYFMILSKERNTLRFIYQVALVPELGKNIRCELERIYTVYFEYSEKLAIAYGIEKSKFVSAFFIFISAIYDYCMLESEGICNRKIDCIYKMLELG